MGFTHRVAKAEDMAALAVAMDAAISELQTEFLTTEQIASTSRSPNDLPAFCATIVDVVCSCINSGVIDQPAWRAP